MSRSTCITCGAVVRDYDEPPDVVPPAGVGLPPHTDPATGKPCTKPVSDWTWNDGRHYWDEDTMEWHCSLCQNPERP